MTIPPQQSFIDAVMEMYLAIPHTPDRFSAHDVYVAKGWFKEGVSIQQIQQAMILAQVRRGYRRSQNPPLNPIRSLHYFSPIIEEIKRSPMEEKYFLYLQRKLTNLQQSQEMDGSRSHLSGSG